MHTVNFTIEDKVWKLLQTVSRGKRSKLVNDAIAQAMGKEQRCAAAQRGDMWKRRLKPVSNEMVLKILRKDRSR